MFLNNSGYKPQVENVATHSRRRYRLIPNQQTGMGNPDPHMWLVHYSRAQAKHQLPSTSLPMLTHTAQVFQARALIQRSGQLPRKEFMLHDRSQWATIQLPAGLGRAAAAGQVAPGHRRGGSLDMQATMEEEEDVSRGDILDFITPREISRMRYEQHHEWMEEILESPYATKQIVPSELGLGKKGTLESLTNGFFTAPTSTTHDTVDGNVGKLAPGKTEDFTKHANEKLAEMEADIEKMKQDHIRRMEKLKRTTDLGAAERKIRNMNPADDGYKQIAAQVQNMMGRRIENVERVHLVEKGGLQDIRPFAPEPQISMQQHMAALQNQQQAQVQAAQNHQRGQQIQQQYQTHAQQQQQPQRQMQQPQPQPQPQQQTEQPVQPPQQTQPQAQIQTQPQNLSQAQPAPAQPAIPPVAPTQPIPPAEPAQLDRPVPESDDRVDNNDALDTVDIDMGDLGDEGGDLDLDANDWDLVNDPQRGENSQTPQGHSDGQQQDQRVQQQMQEPRTQHSSENTPGNGNDFDMVNDFDTLDNTAGDAMDYGGADLDDLNPEVSMFDDAYHHHQEEEDEA